MNNSYFIFYLLSFMWWFGLLIGLLLAQAEGCTRLGATCLESTECCQTSMNQAIVCTPCYYNWTLYTLCTDGTCPNII